jgi:ATP-dependent exoDNAse (exonuclease V) alpha subunit
MKRYQPGQVLTFHKAVKGIAKNESLEVISADTDGVKARKANGQDVTLTSKQAKAYGVFEKEKLEVSAGDKLLLQATWRDKNKNGFRATNGELVTVTSIDGGSIKLQDGRRLPAAYKQFTSGYAVTAHVGQGDTADFVVAAPDGMRKDLAYVALTRGREGLTVVTSDAQALQESIGISGDRQSASELARRADSTARMPAREIAADDYRIYRHFQQQQERPTLQQRPEIKQEITQDVRVERDTGISIGF